MARTCPGHACTCTSAARRRKRERCAAKRRVWLRPQRSSSRPLGPARGRRQRRCGLACVPCVRAHPPVVRLAPSWQSQSPAARSLQMPADAVFAASTTSSAPSMQPEQASMHGACRPEPGRTHDAGRTGVLLSGASRLHLHHRTGALRRRSGGSCPAGRGGARGGSLGGRCAPCPGLTGSTRHGSAPCASLLMRC